MKKFQSYFLLLCTAALVSCVKTEITTQPGEGAVPILFCADAGTIQETGRQVTPKSIVSTPDGLNRQGNKLRVYDKHTIGSNSSMYIDGQDYTYGNSGWITEPQKYWTKQGKHEFTVYNSFMSSSDPGASPTTSGMDAPAVTYDKTTKALDIYNWQLGPDNQFDFMYAHAARDMAQPNPYAPVPLQMKHLLCAVQINITDLIQKESVDEHRNTTIRFVNFKIKNFRDKATHIEIPFSGEPSIALDSKIPNIPYEPDVKNNKLDYAVAHNIYAGSTYGTDGCLLFFPHQKSEFASVSAVLQYDEITWRWSLFGGWKEQVSGKTVNINFADQGTSNNWRAGYKYIYNLYVQDTDIKFEVTVVPWVVDDVILDE